MNYLKKKQWWLFTVGVLFALLELLSFYMSKRPLGASRGYAVIGSIIEYVLFPEHAKTVAYWNAYEPVIEWTVAVLVGIVSGSMFSSVYSGEFKLTVVPQMWKTSKGSSVMRRLIWAFIGGVMIGFGSRLAMGCTLGMLISGVIQLTPAGFIFMMSLWMGGMLMTVLFYRLRTVTLHRG
ncbi:YeeE/YedE thiosulfate transporter family protein [Candidatus Magnetominusculus xianensis]|uniref:YeeE/YedE family protein n=1 Tax=Candidatus Magnetominusculus xianensis TaxID=1748249 RepID=A0ABR5SEI2_9BACT|nr:YeeE/YedE thiosulfate transporter family protein [Candidatus Magnetominusculus xianensis]KWT84410.1 YeeE/YedE family protein [Candidatus Magnetominusculus xianensis]MBF0404244.1 YeeE/YedE family protein [Nitrospirota bacterium]